MHLVKGKFASPFFIRYNNNKKIIEGDRMFYTYLRGLVVLLLWSINGNAHYHNTDKIPNQDENYILVATSPHLVGSSLYGLCD